MGVQGRGWASVQLAKKVKMERRRLLMRKVDLALKAKVAKRVVSLIEDRKASEVPFLEAVAVLRELGLKDDGPEIQQLLTLIWPLNGQVRFGTPPPRRGRNHRHCNWVTMRVSGRDSSRR